MHHLSSSTFLMLAEPMGFKSESILGGVKVWVESKSRKMQELECNFELSQRNVSFTESKLDS